MLKTTNLFERLCEILQNKEKVDRTWAEFKIFFTKAENNHSKRTAKEAGYVNAMTAEKIEEQSKKVYTENSPR